MPDIPIAASLGILLVAALIILVIARRTGAPRRGAGDASGGDVAVSGVAGDCGDTGGCVGDGGSD